MEGKLPRTNRKRPFMEDLDDDDSHGAPKQKKVRFPKGKKVKPGEEVVNLGIPVDGPTDVSDPRLAATERAKRRSQITAELFSEEINDGSAAEMAYKDNENFVDDGIQIEPFNLDREREEGYFDAAGNFVEYVNENEIKDAWLDSVEVDTKYTGKNSIVTAKEDDSNNDLSSEDIGIIKRRIANLLEPGETVLQALRRIKGKTNKRKEKMSAETQQLFDQLTEDANKLLEQGEYNVYNDKQEVFEREAEGYERLAMARGKSTFTSAGQEDFDFSTAKDFSNVTELLAGPSILANTNVDTSNPNGSVADFSSSGADAFDMFADDDDNTVGNPATDRSNSVSDSVANEVSQQSSTETGALPNDYVYDETSGYYYSSNLGYYYDPSTGLYCHASSGQWYSFNEETGTYDEVGMVAPSAN